jgi:magnesium-protoporphyrin O-methyltransferase
MTTIRYEKKRSELEEYFDRTAAQAWARLTSDAPVSGIRATVRAGRDQTREILLSRLPQDLSGTRILDAGCGTGALAIELAKRGAHVMAVDLSSTLTDLAKARIDPSLSHLVEFHAGDMLDPKFGYFDYVVCMDSVIHYQGGDKVSVLSKLAKNTQKKIIFTFAPSTFALELMIRTGKLFPKKDRSPFIVPIAESTIRRDIDNADELQDWEVTFTQKVSSMFYKSQTMEITKK